MKFEQIYKKCKRKQRKAEAKRKKLIDNLQMQKENIFQENLSKQKKIDLEIEADTGKKPEKEVKRRKLKDKWKTEKKYKH